MEIQLSNQYVLFATGTLSTKKMGGYIKKTKDSVSQMELPESEQKMFKKFPFLYEALEKGNTLQMYQQGKTVHALVGRLVKESCKANDYIEVAHSIEAENCVTALLDLEEDIKTSPKKLCLKKAQLTRWGYYE